MTSLVPFDFRCVSQVTGISLRCAPLQISVPSEWPLFYSDSIETTGVQVNNAREPVERNSTILLSSSSVNPGKAGTIDSVTTNSASSSPPATPLLPSKTERMLKRLTEDSFYHSADLANLVAGAAPPSSSSRAQGTHSAARVIRLHDPALCIEAYFTLRLLDAGKEGDEAASNYPDITMAEEYYNDAKVRHSLFTMPAPSYSNSCDTVYVSEVVRGSSHPNWSSIPDAALQPYSQNTCVEVSVFYTGSFLSKACTLAGERHGSDSLRTTTRKAFSVSESRLYDVGNQHTGRQITSLAPSDVCVHRCRVDVRHTYYLGATLEEADTALSRLIWLEEQQAQGAHRLPCPLVFLRCNDGVFVPTSCFAGWRAPVEDTFLEWQAARTRTFCPAPTASDFQSSSPSPSSLNAIAGPNSLAVVAAAQAAAACQELPWSRAPSAVGWRYPASANPRIGQPLATLGDVKAAVVTTLAWEWLAAAAEQRRAILADQLDAEASAHPTARAVAAQCAALRVKLSAAREALTFSTLELEHLRERVRRQQECVLWEEEALAALHHYEARTSSPEVREAQREQDREEEAERAQLRAQLARGRQRRVRELGLVYAVTLSTQYGNHTCGVPADAKDRINNASLPILFAGRAAADASSPLVATTADAMYEEAVALGHACHLLIVLSILYSCSLPYPILLGGSRSHVLASPNLDAAQALTEARKYPLSCHKVSERPLMTAGVHLLLRDGVVLARTMGKPESRIAACADRLGAILDLLLHDVD